MEQVFTVQVNPLRFSGPMHTLGAELRHVQKPPPASRIVPVSELTWIELGHGLLCQMELHQQNGKKNKSIGKTGPREHSSPFCQCYSYTGISLLTAANTGVQTPKRSQLRQMKF